ncbi:MAG: hypothetical protein Kow00106_16430 [Anaerolineae bacterium]
MPRPPRRSISDFDDIPVEELIRLSRALVRRITDQDRQRLILALRESGDARRVWTSAPALLQQFFAGEIDLDEELLSRFPNAPLLSHMHVLPGGSAPLQQQVTVTLGSNDDAATLIVDAALDETAALTFTFSLFSALALRFHLTPLLAVDRAAWLPLLRRENGITVLWTRERWEQPYLILVRREGFGRLYAFSPYGFEAAARLTPDMVTGLADWLERTWFTGENASVPASDGRRTAHALPSSAPDESAAGDALDPGPDTGQFEW